MVSISVVSLYFHRIVCWFVLVFFFFFKQKTAYEMRISDWSSDVCSSDLARKRSRFAPGAPEFCPGFPCKISVLACSRRGRSPCRSAPINPFEKHRELRLPQVRNALLRRRPWNVYARKNLNNEAKTLAIPPEKLDPIGPLLTEPEDPTRPRVTLTPRHP